MLSASKVAPYVGAWIETKRRFANVATSKSHPTWVRGLKLEPIQGYASGTESHPTWVRGLKRLPVRCLPFRSEVAPYVGAWIETQRRCRARDGIGSHPTWVRGLKLPNTNGHTSSRLSHPTWVRGLKLNSLYFLRKWFRRTLRGCVD